MPEIEPLTYVFLFAVRFPDEPDERATRCRHIVSSIEVVGEGPPTQVDVQSHEVERRDLTGKPRWEPAGSQPPAVMMRELFTRVSFSSALEITSYGGGVREVDLGMIIIPRDK